jgi:hypothetical protein
MPISAQQALPFGPVHNVGLFSSHWLEHRLELEPEWQDLRDEASDVLKRLAELWKVERNRVERYGDEQGLEVGFIQPVLRTLGWQMKYQTFVQGREPDYALCFICVPSERMHLERQRRRATRTGMYSRLEEHLLSVSARGKLLFGCTEVVCSLDQRWMLLVLTNAIKELRRGIRRKQRRKLADGLP